MVCRYSHQNQQHVQDALAKLDGRIVLGTSAQASDAQVQRDYTEITQATIARGSDDFQVIDKAGGPSWTRTSDQRIMSPLL